VGVLLGDENMDDTDELNVVLDAMPIVDEDMNELEKVLETMLVEALEKVMVLVLVLVLAWEDELGTALLEDELETVELLAMEELVGADICPELDDEDAADELCGVVNLVAS
jgi:hypothetical protein